MALIHIETVAEIASTNSALMARLGAGDVAAEGYWLIADRQSAGRGRAGRQWSDGLGNFMGSTVAHIGPGDPPAQTLSLVAGVALHRALVACIGVTAGMILKWPNDVLVAGAKLAGILLERRADAVVVGIGVNLVQAPDLPDRATVALAGLGHDLARDAFAQALADEWSATLAHWHDGGWAALRDDWQARAHPPGTPLSARDPAAGLIEGTFAGLDTSGAALLRLADGSCRAIHAGDIDITPLKL
ncbi:biotin--[acetyl-CoA-carboxylase] ligase [Novosphingobium sp.]|uniref:biotin--[acetyl-CoA-carboxylase] ligase n=1 Tax=Novosphingobium sp. TaxID=1874826 RepID=UPI00334120C2